MIEEEIGSRVSGQHLTNWVLTLEMRKAKRNQGLLWHSESVAKG